MLGDEATRGRLGGLLDEAPAFLFAACHGLGFAAGDPEQRDRQGALVCQDWPGPGPGGIDREHYFAAEDVGDAGPRARPRRLLLRLLRRRHAALGRLHPRRTRGSAGRSRSGAFLGRLPQRLLGHPRGGALAVVGHVDRAWGFSLVWPGAGPQISAFESALRRLLDGQPVGWAMEYLQPAVRRARLRPGGGGGGPGVRQAARRGRCSPISGPPATTPATTRSSAIPRCGSPLHPTRRCTVKTDRFSSTSLRAAAVLLIGLLLAAGLPAAGRTIHLGRVKVGVSRRVLLQEVGRRRLPFRSEEVQKQVRRRTAALCRRCLDRTASRPISARRWRT